MKGTPVLDELTRVTWRANAVAAELGLRRETGEADLFGNHSEAIYGGPSDEYRYLLTRRWGTGGTTCTWLMLNPSTATALEDDPTIRRCIDFSKSWGHNALHVVNLFAWRATAPFELRDVADPVGEHNDEFIKRLCHPGWQVIAAWGHHGKIRGRAVRSPGCSPTPASTCRALRSPATASPSTPCTASAA